MFEFLPAWASDVMILLAFVLGPSGLIWAILQQKGANRKLVVEESGLHITEFEALTNTYKDLLARSNAASEAATKAADAAQEEVRQSRIQRELLQEELNEVRDTQRRLRALFSRVIARSGIVLTTEEQKELEATQLRRRSSNQSRSQA